MWSQEGVIAMGVFYCVQDGGENDCLKKGEKHDFVKIGESTDGMMSYLKCKKCEAVYNSGFSR